MLPEPVPSEPLVSEPLVHAAAPRPFGSAVAFAALAALAALSGCATPEAVRRIEAAHPGARYEASAT